MKYLVTSLVVVGTVVAVVACGGGKSGDDRSGTLPPTTTADPTAENQVPAKTTPTPTAAETPNVKLVPLRDVVAISVGHPQACVLQTSGGVKCWGDSKGVGNGAEGGWMKGGFLPSIKGFIYKGRFLAAVDVKGLKTGVKSLSVGEGSSCVIMTTGGVKCWGWNTWGQLGNGTREETWDPVDVVGLPGPATAVVLYEGPIVGEVCAIVSGSVNCWGGGGADYGVKNLADVGASLSDLARGDKCFLSGGALKCWGKQEGGTHVVLDVPGLGSAVQSAGVRRNSTWYGIYTCALLGDGSVKCLDRRVDQAAEAFLVPGLESGVTALAVGATHSCAVVNGAAKCWGSNYRGQLGDGTTSDTHETVISVPVTVKGLESGVTAIAVGDVSCAVVNGGVKCWGPNEFLVLGNGSEDQHADSLVPTDVLTVE